MRQRTHCLKGHLFTEESTGWSGGKRFCRLCADERIKARNAAERKPCARCGGPKAAGQARHYCDDCAMAVKAAKTGPANWAPCITCGGPKEGGGGRRHCLSCSAALKRDTFYKRYGMTGADYDTMLDHQDGRCAICYSKPKTRRLVVDHNHQTGEVRGLLCHRCNHDLLGRARDDPAVLRRAANYLESPPATGTTLVQLGEWSDIRLSTAADEAEERAEGRKWAVLMDDTGDNPVGWVKGEPVPDDAAMAVVSLWLLAELMREDA